jgi:hypothetical protein
VRPLGRKLQEKFAAATSTIPLQNHPQARRGDVQLHGEKRLRPARSAILGGPERSGKPDYWTGNSLYFCVHDPTMN